MRGYVLYRALISIIYQVNHVFGRYPGLITVGRDLEGSHAHYSKGTGIPWLQAQIKQCKWEPTKLIKFLGFLVDSLFMKCSLPGSKIHQIQKECRSMLEKRIATSRQLAQLIGMLTASIPAVL